MYGYAGGDRCWMRRGSGEGRRTIGWLRSVVVEMWNAMQVVRTGRFRETD